jgi:hypothetical protein
MNEDLPRHCLCHDAPEHTTRSTLKTFFRHIGHFSLPSVAPNLMLLVIAFFSIEKEDLFFAGAINTGSADSRHGRRQFYQMIS